MEATVAIVSVIIGVVTFVISFRYGVFTYKSQMNAQLFIEFTKRYDEIMKSLPDYARSARLSTTGGPPKETEELTLYALKYLNLCGDEFYLWKQGMLDNRVWGIWEKELIRTLRSSLYLREWKKLEMEFDSFPDFQNYVNEKQAEKQDKDESSRLLTSIKTSL